MGGRGVARPVIALKIPSTIASTAEWFSEGEEGAPASLSHDEMPSYNDWLLFFSGIPFTKRLCPPWNPSTPTTPILLETVGAGSEQNIGTESQGVQTVRILHGKNDKKRNSNRHKI